MSVGNSNFRARAHAARPVPLPRGVPLGQFHERHAPWGFPALRPLPGPDTGYVPERVWRLESTNGEVTCGDATADIFTASGTPDKWRVVARANGALVVFTDINNLEDDAILLAAGEAVEVYLPRRKVRARNATAAANATLSVEAFFAAPVESFDAR